MCEIHIHRFNGHLPVVTPEFFPAAVFKKRTFEINSTVLFMTVALSVARVRFVKFPVPWGRRLRRQRRPWLHFWREVNKVTNFSVGVKPRQPCRQVEPYISWLSPNPRCQSTAVNSKHRLPSKKNQRLASFFLDAPTDLLWSPYGIGQTIIFSCCSLFFLLFFSSLNLSHRRLDVCHTSTHGVALVQI